MLWYKAWLETRARFLISLCGIAILSSWFVFHEDRMLRTYSGTDWYYRTLHGGHVLLATMWVLAAMLLTMGGLLREKSAGTSAFTLALPVSRARLMRVRILSVLVQAMALVIVPWGLMFLTAIATGGANSVYQALFHVVLLSGGGVLLLAMALLVSSLVEGEYTAPAVSFGLLFTVAVAFSDKPLSAVNPWNFILGSEYIDRKTQMFIGPVPWPHVIANILVAALLAAISIKVVQRREF